MQVYHDFFWYPDPDQRFLIRIRILANDTDPTGSGSETLERTIVNKGKFPNPSLWIQKLNLHVTIWIF